MRSKTLSIILLFIAFLLIPQFYIRVIEGFEHYHKHGTMSYPLLPLIESEISKLRPVIKGRGGEEIMDNICSLARGKKNVEEVINELMEQKINIESIKRSNGPQSLLVNNNKDGQVMVCAAYIINLPYNFPKLVIDSEQAKKSSDNASGNYSNDKSAVVNIDKKKLIRELQFRLAILQVNSEYFSQMSKVLIDNQGKTLVEYRKEIREQFVKTSYDYLRKVYSRIDEFKKYNIYLERITETDLIFSSGVYFFHKNINSTSLKQSGVDMYGGNNLLGSQYYVYATF